MRESKYPILDCITKRLTFNDEQTVRANGGVIFGNPTFSKGEIDLDGNGDYVQYPIAGKMNTAGIGIVMKFTPRFDWDEDVSRFLFDSSSGSRYEINTSQNIDNNVLKLRLGNTQIAHIPSATYSPYWKVNEENKIIISGKTGDTSVWLNGHKILDATATAWTLDNPANLTIGAKYDGDLLFDGKINFFEIYNYKLTDADAEAIQNGYVYKDSNVGLIGRWDLSRKWAIGADQTGDASKNANHGTIYGATYTTDYKGQAGMAMDFDGTDDYISVPCLGLFENEASISFVMEFTPDFDWDINEYIHLFDTSNGARYLIQKASNGVNNTLDLYLNNTLIANIPAVNYSPFWNFGVKNIIIVSGTTGSTDAWLNGNKILDADNTAWSPANPTNLYIGASYSNIGNFDGKIHSFRIYNRLMSDLEVKYIQQKSDNFNHLN